MRKTNALAFFTFFSALPFVAHAESYECRTQQRNYPTEIWGPFDNLIQPQMRIDVDGATATVDDGLIRSINGAPIAAEITENTDKKLVVKWSYVVQGRGTRQATMLFRAAFLKPRNELIVTQAVAGSTSRFHARGVCVWPGMG